MASKKNIIRKLVSKFPEQSDQISEYFLQSSSFRSICEDYVTCFQVLERSYSAARMKKKGYLKEYETLLEELEKELLLNLRHYEKIKLKIK